MPTHHSARCRCARPRMAPDERRRRWTRPSQIHPKVKMPMAARMCGFRWVYIERLAMMTTHPAALSPTMRSTDHGRGAVWVMAQTVHACHSPLAVSPSVKTRASGPEKSACEMKMIGALAAPRTWCKAMDARTVASGKSHATRTVQRFMLSAPRRPEWCLRRTRRRSATSCREHVLPCCWNTGHLLACIHAPPLGSASVLRCASP